MKTNRTLSSLGRASFIFALSSFIFTLSTFISCSQQEIEPIGSIKDAPLAIASAGVAELTTRATISTIGQTDYLTGGSIGVYVYSTTGDSYKGDNIKWTYRNGFWELDAETVVLFENNGEKQQIAAYYPYAEPTEGKVQITLPEAYGDDYDNYDYLYGEYAPLTSNPATIEMKHLMAKVTVNVTTGTDIDAGDGVKSVELVGVPRTADWTLPDVTLSNHGTNAGIALYGEGSAYCGYALPNGAESLALRITTSSGRLFTLTALLDNAETADDIEVLTGGTHYTISVKVGKDKVEHTSVEVIPWAKTTIHGDVAEEIPTNINATAMTPDKLNATVTKALEEGETDITVTLKPDAPAEMITAIRRAICDTDGVADGSIHLTLKGVTSIPGTTNYDGVAFGPGDTRDETGGLLYTEDVTQLASVNLPDVTEIGAQAFLNCSNLTSITAPKLQSIGDWGLQDTAITSIDMPLLKEAGFAAFHSTALTEVSLPSLETAGSALLMDCKQLRTVDLPKLQNLKNQLFDRCTSLVSVNVPAATSMSHSVFCDCSELVSITLPGVTELPEITFEECTKLENVTLGSVITNVNVNLFGGEALSSNITLTLHPDQANVEGDLKATAGTNVAWGGFTWKEVKFSATE